MCRPVRESTYSKWSKPYHQQLGTEGEGTAANTASHDRRKPAYKGQACLTGSRRAPVRSACCISALSLPSSWATAITAITFALQPGTDAPRSHAAEASSEICGDSLLSVDLGCRDKFADKRRSMRLISTDRTEKTLLHTVPAPANKAEARPVSQPVPLIENSAVSQPPAADVVPDASTVFPSDQAEVRSRKNAERQSARARVRQERSFTGAGRGFDAVH
jgi:hypothetical protein